MGYMKVISNPRFRAIYSSVLTTVFSVTVLCGFAMDSSVGLDLRDGQGKPRIVLPGQADERPTFKFLDANEKIVSQLIAYWHRTGPDQANREVESIH